MASILYYRRMNAYNSDIWNLLHVVTLIQQSLSNKMQDMYAEQIVLVIVIS